MVNLGSDIKEEVIKHRREIHKNPELSFKEFETSKYIENVLEQYSIKNYRVIETGVIGIIGDISKKCIALRSDIDALPIDEETALPFASQNKGIMHACGHDFHTAMLLGAAKYLKSIENELDACIMLIFQPAEELVPGGAKLLLEAGLFRDIKPEMVFAQHINPSLKIGIIASKDGGIMASADELYWTFKGKSSHAATPHLGADPIIAASNLIMSLQGLITKFRNPLSPAVLNITAINGGSVTNIIPDEVKLKGTLRTYNDELRFSILEKIKSMSKNIAESFNCISLFEPKLGFPAVINSASAVNIVREAAALSASNKRFTEIEPMMWGEDFSNFSNIIPGCFWFLGTADSEITIPLHNGKLSPDENALESGTLMLINTALCAIKGDQL